MTDVIEHSTIGVDVRQALTFACVDNGGNRVIVGPCRFAGSGSGFVAGLEVLDGLKTELG